jgi:hypothetical protein
MSMIHMASTTVQVAIDNPFSGMVPDFTVFGTEFDAWWKKLLAALWAVLIIAAGAAFMISLLQMRKATSNNIPGQADEAKSHAVWAGGAVVGLASFGVIMGAILTVAG